MKFTKKALYNKTGFILLRVSMCNTHVYDVQVTTPLHIVELASLWLITDGLYKRIY